jgi:FKBP-type peptidyl-prolyl cis-trans isomerase
MTMKHTDMILHRFPTGYALVLALVVFAAGCSKSEAPKQDQPAAAAPQPGATATDLKIEDTKVGTGAEAVAGKSVTVHYTGWFTNGTKFESSKDLGRPFTFRLGAGQVISGWDWGIMGMKVGGVRKLTVPAGLAYGERGAGGVIPPNATLVFEIELLGVN